MQKCIEQKDREDYTIETSPARVLLALFCVNAEEVLSLPIDANTKNTLLELYQLCCKANGRL